jgi:hypothetical protein
LPSVVADRQQEREKLDKEEAEKEEDREGEK